MTKTYTTSVRRWQALIDRDTRADGQFVYAVRTTGVFCRPGCASRQPLRKNVVFFDSPKEARHAGYRACLRCRPTQESTPRPFSRLLVTACRLLEQSDDRPVTSAELAAKIGLSRHYFQRFFKKHLGISPQQYRRRILAEHAKQQLAAAASVTAAAYRAGYNSSNRFYQSAGRELGMAPRAARAGAPEQKLKYATRACSLGRLLIAWTDRGVCDVRFGDTDDEIVSGLAQRFPHAILQRISRHPWASAVLRAVEKPRAIDIPLDIQGTAFQQRIWQELRQIPAGQTRTYSELAAAVGSSESARAVGGACAANHLAVIIPCHRVVRSDGDLSGYRWGVDRKRRLLSREQSECASRERAN